MELIFKKEIWKDIKDYEGLYQISNLGRVRSLLFRNNIVIKKQNRIIINKKEYKATDTLEEAIIKRNAILKEVVSGG